MRNKIIITLITLLIPLFSIAEDASTINSSEISFKTICEIGLMGISAIILLRPSWRIASSVVNFFGVECENCGYTSRSSICPNCGKNIGADKFGAKLSLAGLLFFITSGLACFGIIYLFHYDEIQKFAKESEAQTSAQVQQIEPEKESSIQTSEQVLLKK